MRDEVNEPLGRTSPAPLCAAALAKRFGPRFALGLAAVAVGLAALAIVKSDNRSGGEPFAVARIEQAPPAPPPPAPGPAAVALPATATGDQIEAASGVKVVRNGGGASDALIIDVPQALGVRLTAAPDKRLVEKSRYGLLPRIGADGARPADVYARPVVASARLPAGAPRVAIMVGGLGINAEGTANAIARLPGAVSLGFAPYGGDLERDVAEAREAGHEVLLQAPMESFAYPADNPGPHTLLAGASQSENLDSLHWLMSRFSGYVGVVNYLGGKFTSDAHVLSPALAEIAARGLVYLDDGSSPRSLARQTAATIDLPSGTADVVIDANPTPEAIEAALIRLEALARSHGGAIGVAVALPVSVERIARWSAALEARGVALVPVSALMARGPGPAAQASP
ncbi:MAG: divergent polysaccharide deacetylase family protein [Roseiarcus sp.]